MNFKERPKFNIRIDLLREEMDKEINVEEIRIVKKPIIKLFNFIGYKITNLKKINDYFSFGLQKSFK